MKNKDGWEYIGEYGSNFPQNNMEGVPSWVRKAMRAMDMSRIECEWTDAVHPFYLLRGRHYYYRIFAYHGQGTQVLVLRRPRNMKPPSHSRSSGTEAPIVKLLNKLASLFQNDDKFEWEYIGSNTNRHHIPPWIWAKVQKLETQMTLEDEGRVWRYKGRTFRYKVVAVGAELWVLRRLRHGKG